MYDYDGCCAQDGEVVSITLLLTVNTVREQTLKENLCIGGATSSSHGVLLL